MKQSFTASSLASLVCMVKLIVAVSTLCLSSACANLMLNPPLSGRVVDEVGNPIAGAYVVVAWLERHYSGSACRYVSGAVTDEQGRYSIVDWKGFRSGSVDEYVDREYAPGHTFVERKGGTIVLGKSRRPREERVRELQTIARAITCGEQPGSKSLVAPMFLEIARELEELGGEEAKAVARNYKGLAADVQAEILSKTAAARGAR